ncbi:hypothetical protein [Flavobacterium aurantiibacter]|uniref:Uncharacterized protein n=1 Tax=Flavobacterium aurantiibacter TaxID=2023067 RepID=A0A255ZW00_9FLAO|nr:hypothetical protein [Flavobacterium aurantiibacter]OYQ45572.1 hypothetical protein CHX27_05785 [Flavobacterium aurantiibacter]
MNARDFYRKYDVELIPAALADLTLGKCVWDGGWFDKPSFERKGMPNYIFNAFVAEDLISLDECDEYLERFRTLPRIEAAFSQESVELETDDAIQLGIPQLAKLDAKLDMVKNARFSVLEATGKSIPNRDRIIIDRLLDQLKAKNWDKYRTGLRRAYMITELYYGAVEITIDQKWEAALDANIAATPGEQAVKLKVGKSVSYTFPSGNVPFGMRMERIKFFNS